MSTSSHNERNNRSRWLARGSVLVLLIYWLVLVTATHIPKVPEPLGFRPSDKLVHFAAYALLGALVAFVFAQYRRPSWWTAAGLLLALTIHGALDEATQPLFGRHADVADWGADTIGAALGIGLVMGLVNAAARRWARSARKPTGNAG